MTTENTCWRDLADQLTASQIEDIETVEPRWSADELVMAARYYATLNIEYAAGVSATLPPHHTPRDRRYRQYRVN